MVTEIDKNAQYDKELAEFFAKYPCPSEKPDDSAINYPFILAMYRKNKPRLKKGKTVVRNNHSLEVLMIREFGDLCQIRSSIHHGYSIMAMLFKPSMHFQSYSLGNRYQYAKFATWEHLRRHLVPEERFLVDEMEQIYPSYFIGQLTLPI